MGLGSKGHANSGSRHSGKVETLGHGPAQITANRYTVTPILRRQRRYYARQNHVARRMRNATQVNAAASLSLVTAAACAACCASAQWPQGIPIFIRREDRCAQ
jgi:hypothetical protein